jgi:hypothetical protein
MPEIRGKFDQEFREATIRIVRELAGCLGRPARGLDECPVGVLLGPKATAHNLPGRDPNRTRSGSQQA